MFRFRAKVGLGPEGNGLTRLGLAVNKFANGTAHAHCVMATVVQIRTRSLSPLLIPAFELS